MHTGKAPDLIDLIVGGETHERQDSTPYVLSTTKHEHPSDVADFIGKLGEGRNWKAGETVAEMTQGIKERMHSIGEFLRNIISAFPG